MIAATGIAASEHEAQGGHMAPRSKPRDTALCLNEDDSHYFFSRAGKRLTPADVDSWVDQYAGTQVRELLLCPNCMRTSYASKVWDPIWRGYDPTGPDDQPLLASLPAADRKGVRGWVHTAWQLDQDGIDVYTRWIARARERGISPWITMRMNDVHNVDDEKAYIHSEFWRANPQFRRTPDRFHSWVDRAFDYLHHEVREYHMALVKELIERYDFDGFELDWMRFGFHFRPGHEAEGAEVLTEFTREVRRLLDRAGRKRGRRLKLSARVPSRPATALGLGMDAIEWARRGLVDMLVVTPFWASAETDMPIEVWRGLLHGTKTLLASGLEVLLRPHPDARKMSLNTLKTVRGMASSFLDRGVDRVYLFNYFDSDTAMGDLANYGALLRECGRAETLAGKPRRHVVTFADTWAPGEPAAYALPRDGAPGAHLAFRVHIGPQPAGAPVELRLGVSGAQEADVAKWEVRLGRVRATFAGKATAEEPWPDAPVYAFHPADGSMLRGYNLVEVIPTSGGRIEWVEIAVGG
jgi:hypothetical protein